MAVPQSLRAKKSFLRVGKTSWFFASGADFCRREHLQVVLATDGGKLRMKSAVCLSQVLGWAGQPEFLATLAL